MRTATRAQRAFFVVAHASVQRRRQGERQRHIPVHTSTTMLALAPTTPVRLTPLQARMAAALDRYEQLCREQRRKHPVRATGTVVPRRLDPLFDDLANTRQMADAALEDARSAAVMADVEARRAWNDAQELLDAILRPPHSPSTVTCSMLDDPASCHKRRGVLPPLYDAACDTVDASAN